MSQKPDLKRSVIRPGQFNYFRPEAPAPSLPEATPGKPSKTRRRLITLCVCLVSVVAVTAGLILGRHPGHTNHAPATPPVKQSAATFDKSQFSTTDPASPWVVVNKQHPLQPLDYAPSDLTSVGNGQYMRAEAASALQDMFAAAKSAGLTLTAGSGYRSYATQVTTYQSEVNAYGLATADSESARPGYSEHQTGWAVDIAGGGCYIQDCFGNTAEGKWAAANAYKYGFILRYTAADSAITGYRAEAWHFRYVGKLLAEELHKTGVTTLEQFFGISGGDTYKQ